MMSKTASTLKTTNLRQYCFFNSIIPCILLVFGCNTDPKEEKLVNDVPFKHGLAQKLGGGSTNNAVFGNPTSINIYEAANILGYGAARGNLNHHEYWQNGAPVTSKLDRIIGWYKYGIKPLFLLNHYPDSANPIGSYEKWFAIGAAFAGRFRPNSDFLLSKGIKDWGITEYMAFNEPQWHEIRHPGTMPAAAYKEALRGLADGVHSVDPKLKVSPGGFTFPLWQSVLADPPDLEAINLIREIVPLYNDGTLHALYLHPYVNRRDFKKGRSAQRIFDRVKETLGIKRDIHFAVLEFCFAGSYTLDDQKDDAKGLDQGANVAEHFGKESEEGKAYGMMAALWDNLTVTGNQGQPITDYVLAWEPLTTYLGNRNWGLAKSKAPYEGRLAANVLQLNSYLTTGMSFTRIDHDREVFELEGNGNRLIAWQNWKGWSSITADTFTVTGIPKEAKQLEVFDALCWESGPGFSGVPKPAQVYSLQGENSFTVKGLKTDRTYLFMIWNNKQERTPPSVSLEPLAAYEHGSMIIPAEVNAANGKVLVSRVYNGAHLLAELPGGGPIHYTWKNPPPGLNKIRVTAMDDSGLLNTAQQEITIPHDEPHVKVQEDTYIRGFHKRYSSKNFGALTVLETKVGGNKAIRYSYLKFDLAALPKTFDRCELRLKVDRNSDYPGNQCLLYAVQDNTWAENEMAWDTAPPKGDSLSMAIVPLPGEWITFDISAYIKEKKQNTKQVSFRLEKPNRTHVSFFSKESHPMNAPILSFN